MTKATTSGALSEDLSGMPVADAMREVIRRAVAAGTAEQDALDDAFGYLATRTMELDGPQKTAARFLAVAKAMTELVPPQGARAN